MKLLCLFLIVAVSAAADKRPNILFLHDESTDGRLYNHGSPVPIPNIRKVQERGKHDDGTESPQLHRDCISSAAHWLFLLPRSDL